MQLRRAQDYLGGTVKFVLLFFGGVFVVQQLIINVGHVGGVSMDPTLVDGERFFINKFVYLVHPPRRSDIVQLIDPSKDGQLIVKRVIGLPGETVIIRDNRVVVRDSAGNEETIDETYLPEGTQTHIADDTQEFVVGEYEFFLLGDNRSSSKDSRHFGPLHRKYVNGRVIEL